MFSLSLSPPVSRSPFAQVHTTGNTRASCFCFLVCGCLLHQGDKLCFRKGCETKDLGNLHQSAEREEEMALVALTD